MGTRTYSRNGVLTALGRARQAASGAGGTVNTSELTPTPTNATAFNKTRAARLVDIIASSGKIMSILPDRTSPTGTKKVDNLGSYIADNFVRKTGRLTPEGYKELDIDINGLKEFLNTPNLEQMLTVGTVPDDWVPNRITERAGLKDLYELVALRQALQNPNKIENYEKTVKKVDALFDRANRRQQRYDDASRRYDEFFRELPKAGKAAERAKKLLDSEKGKTLTPAETKKLQDTIEKHEMMKNRQKLVEITYENRRTDLMNTVKAARKLGLNALPTVTGMGDPGGPPRVSWVRTTRDGRLIRVPVDFVGERPKFTDRLKAQQTRQARDTAALDAGFANFGRRNPPTPGD